MDFVLVCVCLGACVRGCLCVCALKYTSLYIGGMLHPFCHVALVLLHKIAVVYWKCASSLIL